jgi:hypothetical protein
MVSKIIKEGIKAVVKRGRKSKRGRPKKKVETPVVAKKKQDPFKIRRLKGESDAAFKKRKARINKLKKAQEKELSKERDTKKPSEKDRFEKSHTIPPERKDMSKAAFRRRVMQDLIGVTKKGETKNIGKYAEPVSETMRKLGYTGSRKGGLDLTEEQLRNMGFQIKKAGGKMMTKKYYKGGTGKKTIQPFKAGAISGATAATIRLSPKLSKTPKRTKTKKPPVGTGKALRGYGKSRKK